MEKYSKISSHILLLTLITLPINFSEQIKWITESRTVDVCKGNNVDLLWKFDDEGNMISKLEWYFNKKMICTSSDAEDFTVNNPYQGRLERLGKTEIRLKNISLEDEGIFILLPVLTWSTSQNMQNISLQVLEPPKDKCTCKINYIRHLAILVSEITSSYCGRPQVSAVWETKEKHTMLGKGNSILINSSFQDSEALCCLEGPAMKCVDDHRQFCTSVSIPYQGDEKPSKGRNNTQQMDSVTNPVPQDRDTGSTNLYYIQPYVLVTMTVSSMAAIFALVILVIHCRKRKNNKDMADKQEKQLQSMMRKEINTNTAEQMEETCPLLAKNRKLHSAVITVSRSGQEYETNEAATEYKSTTNSENIKNMHHCNICKICSANSVNVVFIPCNHIVVCDICSDTLQQCPSCEVLIEEKIDIILT